VGAGSDVENGRLASDNTVVALIEFVISGLGRVQPRRPQGLHHCPAGECNWWRRPGFNNVSTSRVLSIFEKEGFVPVAACGSNSACIRKSGGLGDHAVMHKRV
jgi:hypothetical protein